MAPRPGDVTPRFYRAIAYQAPGDVPDDGWDVIFPDFPGCTSKGDTAQEAMKNAIEALELHLEGMVAEGQKIPPESRMNEHDKQWVLNIKMQHEAIAFVPVIVPGKSVRMDVTMDQALIKRLDAAASSEGTTRSGYLAQAVREKLQRSRENA
jgi:predicted RNase H-like HicB family nuclease